MRPLLAAVLIAAGAIGSLPQNGNGHSQAEPAKPTATSAPAVELVKVSAPPAAPVSAQDRFEQEIFEIQLQIKSPTDREALRQWVVWLTKKRAKLASGQTPNIDEVLKRCGLYQTTIRTTAAGQSAPFIDEAGADSADGDAGPIGRLGRAAVAGGRAVVRGPIKVFRKIRQRERFRPFRRLFGRRGC